MSDNQDSGPFGGAILAILGVAIGVALLQAGSSDEGSGYSGVKSAATREDTPPIRMQGSAVPDAADEVVDEELAEIPAEVAQKPDSADNLRRGLLDFDCPVEPASATGQGRLRFVTWPGPGSHSPAIHSCCARLVPRCRWPTDGSASRSRCGKKTSEHHIVHEADLLVPASSHSGSAARPRPGGARAMGVRFSSRLVGMAWWVPSHPPGRSALGCRRRGLRRAGADRW